MDEVWKAIPDYEGYYEASSLGRIRSVDRLIIDKIGRSYWLHGKVLKPGRTGGGNGREKKYLGVVLCKDAKPDFQELQRLVARTFIGKPPPGMEACHNDGDGTNNALSNIRYDTHLNNMRDAVKVGKHAHGERQGHALLTEEDVKAIRLARASGQRWSAIARTYGVTPVAIYRVVKRQTWNHVL